MFGDTFEMLGASWHVLKKDMEITLFFLLAMACKLGLIYFAYKNFIVLYPDGFESVRQDLQGDRQKLYIAGGALIFAYHLIGQFFNAAIVGSAARRLQGGNPNVFTGIFDALKRLPSLMIWVVVYACLMTITGMFKRKGKIQKMFGGAVQGAFHVLTFFVLPLIMIENANPFGAMGRSSSLLGKTWGHQIVANISMFVFRFIASIPGIAVIAGGVYFFQDDQMRMISAGVGSFLLVMGAGVIQTLTEIYRTALFLYVRDQKAPQGFADHKLQNAFKAA